jgi:hypothetical protein
MELHEPIDVGCKSINAILHDRESLIHIFAEIINIKLDKFNPAIYPVKSFIDPLKPCIYLAESFIDLPKSCVYLPKSCVYLPKSCVYLPKSSIRLSKSSPNKLFERREMLSDSTRLLTRALLCHLSYLAVLSPFKSQEIKIKSLDHLIRPEKNRLRNRDANLLGRFQINHQLELRRLFNREIGGLGALQDSVHEICDAPVAVREVRAVGHEPAGIYSFSTLEYRR